MVSTLFAVALCTLVPDSGSNGYLDLQRETPVLSIVGAGYGKIAIDVTAGSDGAPDGFTLWWMTEADFNAAGNRWQAGGSASQGEAVFVGWPTLNSWGAADYQLDPLETVTVEIGDLLDETGVLTNWTDELDPGTRYVFTAFVNGGARIRPSDETAALTDETRPSSTCTFTRASWEHNPQNWPVQSLLLGNVPYNQAQLLSILQQPGSSNGLVLLARQLIAAKLNVANGANPGSVQQSIAAADALIGFSVVPPVGSGTLSPLQVRDLVQTLDDFNHGVAVSDPCAPTSVRSTTWGSTKALYR